jgi:hypothetical protein
MPGKSLPYESFFETPLENYREFLVGGGRKVRPLFYHNLEIDLLRHNFGKNDEFFIWGEICLLK